MTITSNIEGVSSEANLVKALELLRDNAYLAYGRLYNGDLVKGADWYIENSQVDRQRLEAHQTSAQWLGKHQAYAQVLRMIRRKEFA